MHRLTTAVGDKEQHVEGLEGQGLDHQVVGRPVRERVVPQERTPGLARRTRRGPPPERRMEPLPTATPACAARRGRARCPRAGSPPSGDGAGLAPPRQPWPPGWTSGPPPPEEAPALLLPAGHRLRLHRLEMAAPVGTRRRATAQKSRPGQRPRGADGCAARRRVAAGAARSPPRGLSAPGGHGPRARCRRGAATGPTRRSDRLRCLTPHGGSSCAPTGGRAPCPAAAD